LPSITGSVILACVIWTLLNPWSYYNGFKHHKVRLQGTAGKGKHVALTVPQTLVITGELEIAKPKRGYGIIQCWVVIHDIRKQKDQL
jgi:hypothetical protein